MLDVLKSRIARIAASFGLAAMLTAAAAVPSAAQAGKSPLKPMDVFDLQWVSDPQISPDGRSIAYVRMRMDTKTDKPHGVIWLTGADGRHSRPLSSSDHSMRPRWSPDGARIAYIGTGSDGSNQLFMYWTDSNVTAAISHFTESPTSLAWSPDGRWLAFTMPVPAERKPLKVELPEAPKGAKWADPPKLIDRMVFRADGEGYLPNSFSQLFVVAADGGGARQLTHGDYDHEGTPAWSADGKSVLIAANRRADADYEPIDTEIYRVDLSDDSIHALTDRRGPDYSPAVSPDGKHIAYLGFDDKRLGYQATQLYVMDADGSDVQKLQLSDMGYVIDPAWSPNGQLLAFSWRRPNGNYDLYVTDVASHQLVQLTRDAGRNERPSWAPDGRHLVFESTRGGTRQIWSMLADGSNLRQLTTQGDNESPNWSPK